MTITRYQIKQRCIRRVSLWSGCLSANTSRMRLGSSTRFPTAMQPSRSSIVTVPSSQWRIYWKSCRTRHLAENKGTSTSLRARRKAGYVVQERSPASCSARGDDTNKSMKWTRTQYASVHEAILVPGIIRRRECWQASRTRPRISARTTATACPNLLPTHTGSSETKIESTTNPHTCDSAGNVLKTVHWTLHSFQEHTTKFALLITCLVQKC